jgi:hypothetical protein
MLERPHFAEIITRVVALHQASTYFEAPSAQIKAASASSKEVNGKFSYQIPILFIIIMLEQEERVFKVQS